MTRGFYIVFEGIEGSGKSTQARLLAENLEREGYLVVQTREPGGSGVAEKIRDVLLSRENKIDLVAEAYLFAASRAQSLREVVLPALQAGKVVVAERSFYSSLVYQGLGRGLGVDKIWQINKEAVGDVKPDLVVFTDISFEEGFSRLAKSGKKKDRIEEEGTADFYGKIRKGYLNLAKKEPGRWLLLDAALPIEEQAELIEKEVLKRVE